MFEITAGRLQFQDKYGIESDGAGLIDVARAGGVIDGDGEIFRGEVAVKNTETPIFHVFLTMFSLDWVIDHVFLPEGKCGTYACSLLCHNRVLLSVIITVSVTGMCHDSCASGIGFVFKGIHKQARRPTTTTFE